jgi:hypothetical protein
MCDAPVAWTMAATQPHEEDGMALLQMKLIRGLFGAPRRRERASRSDSSTNADRAIFAALPDVAAESTNKRNGRAPLGLARIAVLGALVALAAGGSAFAFQALPPGTQVNDDRAAGIDKTISISGHDAGNADVVGGALVAGKPGVPWAVFRQQETNGSPPPHDQVFARSFAGGAWTTRGNGTVGGRSSATPTFSGSLNFDQNQDGEAPAIDFAGTGRTVPWATWYENTTGTGFANNNIFATRFDNTGGPNQGKWIFAGQARGTGEGTVPVPSLNIHTDQAAENPSVAGGSAVDPTKPGPWVTWQETTNLPVERTAQIFVERPIGPGAANCDGVKPAGVEVGGHVPAIGGFCFQQTGIPRVGTGGADPSLNVDPTREGVEPDVAFTGAQDAVPWVVWYERGASTIPGLHENEMVFAAKGVGDGVGANGGFHWVAVGSQLASMLDTSGVNGFGACAESAENESLCSLNKTAKSDAENARVAGGTMNPANTTVPWVAWDEDLAGVRQVFVSRLVGTGASAHFELVNGGAPISIGANDSTRPDISFSGNTPYVSWREDIGGGIVKAFTGHFVNAANPTFVLDEGNVPLTPTDEADVREPISSSCIATPFNSDGAACQGGSLGTPFFLFTNGTSPRGLFANAYQPGAPLTGPSSNVGSSTATVSGTINPEGAAVKVSFDYGTTTAYGQSTAAQSTGVSNASTSFSAELTGLPAGTAIHYRAVAVSDFGTFLGADQTLTTTTPPTSPPAPGATPPGEAKASAAKARVSGTSATVRLSCAGSAGASCRIALRLTVTERFKGHKLIAVTAGTSRHGRAKVAVIGTANVTLNAGQAQTVRITLSRAGKRLLAHRHVLKSRLRITQATSTAAAVVVSSQIVTFKATNKRHAHRGH